MLEAGRVRYEVEDKGSNETLLHCYIPYNFTSRDVDLSYEVDGISKGRIAIHFDTTFRQKLGCVELDGFTFPENIEAKFNKKHARYTFRLLRSQKAAPSSDSEEKDADTQTDQDLDVDAPEHFSDAASSGPRSSSPDSGDLLPSAAPTANGNGIYTHHHPHHQPSAELGSTELLIGSDLSQAGATADMAAAGTGADFEAAAAADAEANDDEMLDDQEQDNEADEGDETTAEGAAKKGKKRRGQRKKKKKKGKAGADDASATDADVATAARADTADSSKTTAAAAAVEPPTADQDDQEVFLDAISEGGDDLLLPDAQQQQQQQDVPASPAAAAPAVDESAFLSPRSTASSSKGPAAPPVVFNTDNFMSHFTEEPCAGHTQLPVNANEVLQLPESLLQGPFVSQCLDTHVHKGEDKGMRVVGAKWTPLGSSVGTSFSAFGIFDGHGGKPAATYASKELLPNVMRLVDRCKEGSSGGTLSRQPSTAVPSSPAAGAGSDDEAWSIDVSDQDKAVWAAQEALADRLPKALFAGFLEADKICRQRHKTSGTTATLAVAVGWELFVANVGDSAAYLDTGKEVIAVSGNHRIDDNPAERARIIAAGGDVSKSCPDGIPVGPDRVWPGGLAMSRTIGDPHAPQVIAVPDIRHVTLPTTGGRLVIASDGVWDHMQPKGMIHQVRNENTEAAAKKLAYAALKKKGLRDDISVLVVDFTPAPDDPRPPALLQGPQRDAVEACQVSRPLMEVEVEAAVIASAADSGASADQIAAALQRQASITTVAASGTGHWREVAAARRTSALQLLRQQARREAEAAAAEAARLAELAAKAEAETKSGGDVSDTYRELAELRIDPDAIVAQVQEQQQQEGVAAAAAADEADGWETVGSSSAGAAAGEAGSSGYVPFEQQIRRGAGRGAGRGRGRGRDHHQQQQQQDKGYRESRRRDYRQEGDSSAAAAPVATNEGVADAGTAADNGQDLQQQQQQQRYEGGRGSRGGRGLRGRGRGDRPHQSGYERSDSSERPLRRDRSDRGGRSRYHAEQQQQQQHDQSANGDAAAAAAPAAGEVDASGGYEQQQLQYGGRGRGGGDRGGYRGQGYRGRGRGSTAAAGAAGDSTPQQQQQQSEHADATHEASDSYDQAVCSLRCTAEVYRPVGAQQPTTGQQQQQQNRPRQPRQQREYKPVAPDAAAAAPDANGSAAAAAAAAVKAIPRPSGKPATSTSICYKCQQPGHFARDCPSNAAAAAAGSSSAAAYANGGHDNTGGSDQLYDSNAGSSASGSGRGGRGSGFYRGRGRRGGGGYRGRGGRGYDRPQQQQQQEQAV